MSLTDTLLLNIIANATGGPSITALTTALAGLAAGALALGKSAVTAAAEYEQTEVTFTRMLGSAKAAKQFLGELATFAANTPFELKGLQQQAVALMNMGFEAKQIIPTLTAVGDAAGGQQEKIDRVVTALGQMRAKTKISAEEMNQLAEAGIPAWDMLAKQIGISVPEAMKRAQAGTLSAAEGIPAILQGMQDRFSGQMEAQSKTLLGKWSNVQDNLQQTLVKVGDTIIKAFRLDEVLDTVNGKLAEVKSYFEKFDLRTWAEENRQMIYMVAGGLTVVLLPALVSAGAAFLALAAPIAPLLVIGAALGLLLNSLGIDFDDIGTAIQGVVKWFKGLQTDAGGSLERLKAIAAPLLDSLGRAFRDAFAVANEAYQRVLVPIFEWLKSQLGGYIEPAKTLIYGFGELVAGAFAAIRWTVENVLIPAFETIWPVAKVVFDALGKMIQGALDIIGGLMKAAGLALQGDWKGAWDAISKETGGQLDEINKAIENGVPNAQAALKTLGEKMLAGFKIGLGSIGSVVLDWIASALDALADKVPAVIGRALRNGAEQARRDAASGRAAVDEAKGDYASAGKVYGPQLGGSAATNIAAEQGKFGYAFISSLAGVFKNDPRVDSDCAVIAYAVLDKLGTKIKGTQLQNANAGALEKNAIASGFTKVEGDEIRPGDLIIWTSGNGKTYGKVSGKHAGVGAGTLDGKVQVLNNPGSSNTVVEAMYDRQNATVYRAPDSPFAMPRASGTAPSAAQATAGGASTPTATGGKTNFGGFGGDAPPPSGDTGPITAAQIVKAQQLLAALEAARKAVEANPKNNGLRLAFDAADQALKNWSKTSETNARAVAAAQVQGEKLAQDRLRLEQDINASLAQGRIDAAQRSLTELKRLQGEELSTDELTAQQRAAIVKRTGPQILAAEATINERVRSQSVQAAQVWADEQLKIEGVSTKAIEAERRRRVQAAYTIETQGNKTARAEQTSAQQRTDQSAKQERIRFAQELSGLQLQSAQATSQRLNGLAAADLVHQGADLSKKLTLTKQYADEQYKRDGQLAAKTRDLAIQAAKDKGGPNVSASIQLAKDTYSASESAARLAQQKAEADAEKAVTEAIQKSRTAYGDLASGIRDKAAAGKLDDATMASAVKTLDDLTKKTDAVGISGNKYLIVARKNAEATYQAGIDAQIATGSYNGLVDSFDRAAKAQDTVVLSLQDAVDLLPSGDDAVASYVKNLADLEKQGFAAAGSVKAVVDEINRLKNEDIQSALDIDLENRAFDVVQDGAKGLDGTIKKFEAVTYTTKELIDQIPLVKDGFDGYEQYLESLASKSGITAKQLADLKAILDALRNVGPLDEQLPDNLQGRGSNKEITAPNDPANGSLTDGARKSLLDALDAMQSDDKPKEIGARLATLVAKGFGDSDLAQLLRTYLQDAEKSVRDSLSEFGGAGVKLGTDAQGNATQKTTYQTDKEVRGIGVKSEVDTQPYLDLQAVIKNTAGVSRDELEGLIATMKLTDEEGQNIRDGWLKNNEAALASVKGYDELGNAIYETDNEVRGIGVTVDDTSDSFIDMGDVIQSAMSMSRVEMEEALKTAGLLPEQIDEVRKAWRDFHLESEQTAALDQQLAPVAEQLQGIYDALDNGSSSAKDARTTLAAVRAELSRIGGEEAKNLVEAIAKTVKGFDDLADVSKKVAKAQDDLKNGTKLSSEGLEELIAELQKLRKEPGAAVSEIDALIASLTGLDAAAKKQDGIEKTVSKINDFGKYAQQLVPVVTGAMQALGGASGEVAGQWGDDLGSMVSDLTNFGVAIAKGDYFGAAVQTVTSIFTFFSRKAEAFKQELKKTADYNKGFRFDNEGYGTRKVEQYTTGILLWQNTHFKETIDEAGKKTALTIEDATVSGFSSGFEKAFQTGDITAVEKAVTSSIKDSALKGLVEGFLNSAPVIAALGPLVKELKDAFLSNDEDQISAALGKFKVGIAKLRPEIEATVKTGNAIVKEFAASMVDTISSALESGIQSGARSGIQKAIASGSTAELGKDIRLQAEQNLQQALIDTFLNSAVMVAMIKPAMDALATALSDDDPTNDDAAFSAFDTALDRYTAASEKFSQRTRTQLQKHGLAGDGATSGSISNIPVATDKDLIATLNDGDPSNDAAALGKYKASLGSNGGSVSYQVGSTGVIGSDQTYRDFGANISTLAASLKSVPDLIGAMRDTARTNLDAAMKNLQAANIQIQAAGMQFAKNREQPRLSFEGAQ